MHVRYLVIKYLVLCLRVCVSEHDNVLLRTNRTEKKTQVLVKSATKKVRTLTAALFVLAKGTFRYPIAFLPRLEAIAVVAAELIRAARGGCVGYWKTLLMSLSSQPSEGGKVWDKNKGGKAKGR